MALLRPPTHDSESNPPSANEISTDNADQLDLLQKPENERLHQLHQLPPHEINPDSANVEQLNLLENLENERHPQLPLHELNPPSADEVSTDNTEQSVLLENPEKEKEQLHHIPPPRRREIYFLSAKIGLVLVFTIFYHTFCFIAHYRSIPIGNLGLSFLQVHFNIASVITTVAILIVYVALWPVKGVVDEIRAEEFFRLIHAYPNGLPLDSVNAVSATTTGAFDIFMATIHRHCSPLLTSTLVISLLITATSSIAPAALGAGSIEVDIENSAFLIGALPINSFLMDFSSITGGVNASVLNLSFLAPIETALTMTWVENVLNFTNGYYKVTSSEGDQSEYIVPFPPAFTSTMKAYWTTDVIVPDPSCSWQTPTRTSYVNSILNVTLAESNKNISFSDGLFEGRVSNVGSVIALISSEFNVPVDSDGSVVFVYNMSIPTNVDFSSIPTVKLPTDVVLAFLLCSPHFSIQTHQVRAFGNGNLTLGKPQPRQGNIDFDQANYLLSYLLHDFPLKSGPTGAPEGQVGTDMMQRFIFGDQLEDGYQPQVVPFRPPTGPLQPVPITDITAMYKQVIQSAMKFFLSGGLAAESVPGGYTEEQMVFTSSLGHVFASLVLFVFLTIALVAAQFRKRQDAFTFVNVAAALADSEVPQKCVDMTQFKAAGTGERKVLKFVTGGDGQLNRAYQSIV